MKGLLLSILSFYLMNLCTSWESYQKLIPNGNKLSHPCLEGVIWAGVGHIKYEGKNDRNTFGSDFQEAGHKWTTEFCQKDSDSDGKTNGQELGDPDCVWKAGSTPNITDSSRLTHPGICEPLGSVKCKEFNVKFGLTCSGAILSTKYLILFMQISVALFFLRQ